MTAHHPTHPARNSLGWPAHAAAATLLLTTMAVLWPPRPGEPAVPAWQTRGVEELAALLGEPSPRPDAIEENLREWTRFPPLEAEGRVLAGAVAGCSMAALPEPTRVTLGRSLYVITNGSDLTDRDLARTLDGFQRAAAQAGCRPDATLTLLDALRRTARHDPRPRADWW